jgi:hypothetical protein
MNEEGEGARTQGIKVVGWCASSQVHEAAACGLHEACHLGAGAAAVRQLAACTAWTVGGRRLATRRSRKCTSLTFA